MKIAICIITYMRPEGLTRLLLSLDKLRFNKSVRPEISIIVVDNDARSSASAICKSVLEQVSITIKYDVETKRGIPFARNKVISLVETDVDFIAFIDDDEVPEPQWLDELLFIQQSTGAHVIMGPVLPIYLSNVPKWIINSKLHHSRSYKNGSIIKYASTNNVLFSFDIIRNLHLRFNEEMTMTGGTDTLFFMTAQKSGYIFAWASNAIVKESIPASRATIKWLLIRSFRLGNSLSICDLYLNYSLKSIFVRALKGIMRILYGMIMLLTLGIKGRIGVLQAMQNIFRGAGTIAGLMNIRFDEYKRIHGE